MLRALGVLIVDDDPLVGALLADVLGDMGYAVCAIEGTEAGAVRAAARHRPDLMIVDVKLGSGSGVVAMAHILRTRFVSHLYMTCNTSKLDSLSSEAVVLRKPFNAAQLARAIRQVLAIAVGPV